MNKRLCRPCPVCCSPLGVVLHTQCFAMIDEIEMESEVDIVTCVACGMVFSDLKATQEELDRNYEDHSKYADTTLYGEESEEGFSPGAQWDIDRLDATAAWLVERLEGDELRLLDAGCATGTFLGALKERGWKKLLGLDPSPVATATVTKVYGIETVTGSFFSPPTQMGQFDVVTLSHVLEHLTDVRGAIQGIQKMVKNGGYAYIEVPGASSYADYLVSPFHDFNTEHINHFSLDILDRLMAEFGFNQVETGEKVVKCSAKHDYPAIYGLWRQEEDVKKIDYKRDEALVTSIVNYVTASREKMVEFDACLQSELVGEEKLVIWGAGQLALKLMVETVLAKKKIVAIIDGSPEKHGMHLGGIEVMDPKEARGLELPVVVASVHHSKEILDVLEADADLLLRPIVLS